MKTAHDFGSFKDPNLESMMNQATRLLSGMYSTLLGVEFQNYSALEFVEGKGYPAKATAEAFAIDGAREFLGNLTMIALRPGDGTGVRQELNGHKIPGLFTTADKPWVVIPRDKNMGDTILKEFLIPLGTYNQKNFALINSVWESSYENNNPKNRIVFLQDLGLPIRDYVPMAKMLHLAQDKFMPLGVTLEEPRDFNSKEDLSQRQGAYHSIVVPEYYPNRTQMFGFFQITKDNRSYFANNLLMNLKN